MALSDDEQRLLDEMERNLYKNDADIVSTTTGPRTVDYTKVAVGVLGIAVGLVLVIVGVTTKLLILGVAGFGAAVFGALWALSASRPAAEGDTSQRTQGPGPVGATRGGSGSLMDRLSQEWDDRNER